MMDAVSWNIMRREEVAAVDGGFAKLGNDRRMAVARDLLARLRAGVAPTTREVVAYFGKGARFVDKERP